MSQRIVTKIFVTLFLLTTACAENSRSPGGFGINMNDEEKQTQSSGSNGGSSNSGSGEENYSEQTQDPATSSVSSNNGSSGEAQQGAASEAPSAVAVLMRSAGLDTSCDFDWQCKVSVLRSEQCDGAATQFAYSTKSARQDPKSKVDNYNAKVCNSLRESGCEVVKTCSNPVSFAQPKCEQNRCVLPSK